MYSYILIVEKVTEGEAEPVVAQHSISILMQSLVKKEGSQYCHCSASWTQTGS